MAIFGAWSACSSSSCIASAKGVGLVSVYRSLDRRGNFVRARLAPAPFLGSALLAAPLALLPASEQNGRRRPQLGVQRYLARVSGPLLDRIDLHLDVPTVAYQALAERGGGEPSEAMRARVDRARLV